MKTSGIIKALETLFLRRHSTCLMNPVMIHVKGEGSWRTFVSRMVLRWTFWNKNTKRLCIYQIKYSRLCINRVLSNVLSLPWMLTQMVLKVVTLAWKRFLKHFQEVIPRTAIIIASVLSSMKSYHQIWFLLSVKRRRIKESKSLQIRGSTLQRQHIVSCLQTHIIKYSWMW